MDAGDIDPAIAAAMGFSGFGAQPGGKKRKFDTGSFVDPAVSKQPQEAGTGANNTVVADRTGPRGGGADGRHAAGRRNAPSSADQTASREQPAPTASVAESSDAARVQALRNGVPDENGDMVYFLPSFIQDPWKDLRPS